MKREGAQGAVMGAVQAFGRWFGSAGAVLWIFALTSLAVAIELAFPHLDSHGFWFLYWITYGSWITQPVLAYATRLDTARSDKILDRLATVEEQNVTLLKQNATLLERLDAGEAEELTILRAQDGHARRSLLRPVRSLA